MIASLPLQVRSATEGDDAALRGLLRETPLPGAVSVTLERGPSFFGGDVDAARHDVAVVTREEKIIACGSRILRRSWWGGVETDTAYLADLRVHPSFQRRAGWALRDGYRYLNDFANEHPAAVTWTAVFESNRSARRVLVGRTAGLPQYLDRGRLLCPMLLVPRRATPPHISGLIWQMGTQDCWEEIADFLTAWQRHRLLAPAHCAEDFAESQRWPELRAEDFLLLRRGLALVGVIAVWDMRALRQVRVKGFQGGLRWARPLISFGAKLSGWPALPDEGSILPLGFASFLAVENDDPVLAALLLRGARAAAARRGLHYLCACLHEDDPLSPALRGLPAIASHGRLYEVVPPKASAVWTAGLPHIEAATL